MTNVFVIFDKMSFFPIKKEFEHLTNISLPRKPVNDIVIGGKFFLLFLYEKTGNFSFNFYQTFFKFQNYKDILQFIFQIIKENLHIP